MSQEREVTKHRGCAAKRDPAATKRKKKKKKKKRKKKKGGRKKKKRPEIGEYHPWEALHLLFSKIPLPRKYD